MKQLLIGSLLCLSLFSLPAQSTQPIQSKTVLRIIQAAGKTPGRYNALIFFEHKTYNYAFAAMQATINFLKQYNFPGPIVVVMNTIRFWSDQQIINHYYSDLNTPVLLDTFGIFRELRFPPRIFPFLTIWDSTGTLRYGSSIPPRLSGQLYQRLINRLDSLPPKTALRIQSKIQKPQYQTPFESHLQSLPVLAPQQQITLEDDSTTLTGRLQRLRCSSSEHWCVLSDLDQEVVRIYRLPTGEEFTQITTSPDLHRRVSPIPFDVLSPFSQTLGMLTHFVDLAEFVPENDSIVAHQFFTVIDTLLIHKTDQGLDTNLRLGKRYVLATYAPPYDSLLHWVLLQPPKAPPYLWKQEPSLTLTPWNSVLFSVVNWVQQQNAQIPGVPLDPQSPEFEANDPLLWEFSLSTGKFIRSYGDLSFNRNILGIGYRNFDLCIDCNGTDCAYLATLHDTLYFLRSGEAYPIKTYYPPSILQPQKDSSLLHYTPKERMKKIYALSPIQPIDLTIADSFISIVWYHFGTGESIWQIYSRSPFKLIAEYRINPSPLRESSPLPAPQIEVSKNLTLYLFDQSPYRSMLWIYRPNLNIKG